MTDVNSLTKEELECYNLYKRYSTGHPMARPLLYTKQALPDKESCIKRLEILKKLKMGLDIARSHKDMYKNTYDGEIRMVKSIMGFYEKGVDFVFQSDPIFVEVKTVKGSTLVYRLTTGRWKQKGKAKWYYSKDAGDFVAKYCL